MYILLRLQSKNLIFISIFFYKLAIYYFLIEYLV